MNLLFVCSRNQWRSPTAEKVFGKQQGFNTRSVGTEPSARIKVTEQHIKWADIIFVMEKKHKQRLFQKFAELLDEKRVEILDIEDNYQFMDEELIHVLELSVNPILEQSMGK